MAYSTVREFTGGAAWEGVGIWKPDTYGLAVRLRGWAGLSREIEVMARIRTCPSFLQHQLSTLVERIELAAAAPENG
jgi:hypothetical protein